MANKVFHLNLDDDAISDLLRKGDIKTYEELFHRFYGVLCLYARKKVGDMDNARDIVQLVFVRLYENRQQLHIDLSVKAYLFKSVYHACLNFIAQKRMHLLHHERLSYQIPFSQEDDHVIQAELEEKITVIVNGLPEQCRKIFIMNRYDGKRNSEIAEQLGISVRTVETQISKALSVLRLHLTEYLSLSILLVGAL